MRAATEWESYVHSFHADHPGITEQAFRHAAHPEVGTPYAWLVEALDRPLGRVLDVACGNAALLPWLDGYEAYLGLDTSEDEVARARLLQRGPVLLADARRLPVADASVDTVVSSMGLMLVDPVERALAEVRRALAPGGTLALLVPSVWPVSLRDARLGLPLALALRGPGSMPQHFFVHRLRRLLEAAGLNMVDAQRRRFPFPVRGATDATLAVQSLYTPGRSTHSLVRGQRVLTRLAGAEAELPVPLLRVLARG